VTRRGFTLIELLVSIGVIALLLTVLIAALGASTVRARTVACLTKNRSLVAAATSFAFDHNERVQIGGRIFVSELDTPESMPDLETYTEFGALGDKIRPLPFTAALAPYLQMTVRSDSRDQLAADLVSVDRLEPVLCPADQERAAGRMIANRSLSWSAPMGVSSYGFNDAVMGVHPASGPRAYGYLSKVTLPSKTMLFGDAQPRNGDDGLTPHWLSYFNESDDTTLLDCLRRTDGGSPSVFPRERHGGAMTVTFADGSGRVVKLSSDEQLEAVGISVGVLGYR